MQCHKCCERDFQRCTICLERTSFRNRGMENVLDKLQFRCPNADVGCQEYVSYGDTLDERSTHLPQCKFNCVCPFRYCDCIGSHKELYEHVTSEHLEELTSFEPGKNISLFVGWDETLVLREHGSVDDELVVVYRHLSLSGEYMTVRCIAPPGKGNFTYRLTLHSGPRDKISRVGDIKVVDKVNSETPEVDFLFASSDFVIT